MAANNYSASIPATAAMAHPGAAAENQDAGELLQGNPRTLVDLTNAVRETEHRRRLKANHPPSLTTVTSDELARSVLRQHAVASELAASEYAAGGGAGVPFWAQAMQNTLNDIKNDQTNMKNDLNDIKVALGEMQQRERNDRARRRNGSKPAFSEDMLLILRKERAGWGQPLPGGYGQVPAGNPPAASTMCPVAPTAPCFPQTVQQCMGLTDDQIGNLSVWFNDDFGIVAADTVADRRAKFMDFIAH
eukprot:CAMPEP_0117028038 /NCGR_PEP_ID=MMETSP0472-20121206/20426_1 /TAXON_ID=693140 ORGANISM="Tiarina fusus, Strain LIS" /NCGR_SAMPLE_ID=MMETSP0472 /ASSEMBLY_ACC=CAM_ASM_000603 /LENGTH=246 /DNA_ID=CAMNT_0004735423 /DNA_START=61 /DNA_END=801 /DNA_ORIENTATION=+